MEYIQLNNGAKVPVLCYGPGMMTRGISFKQNSILGKLVNKAKMQIISADYTHSIENAIVAGARFIDYSATYKKENLVAKAIKESGVKREEFFLTTRVPNSAQFSGNIRNAVLDSIKRFQTDYIDLLMFHWPVTNVYVDTWKEMIALQEEGICKCIGVANCHQQHIETLIKETGVTPVINQVEVHPLFSQKKLIKYCQSKDIVVEAYTPLARMDERMTRLPLIKTIANKHNKTISQIILRWHVQNGVIPVFRSMNASRQKENFNIFDFTLGDEDMRAIDSININSRLRYDPDNCDFTIL